MTLVKNRVPALSHDNNAIPRHTLKSLFLSDVDRLAADGHFKGTKRIALRAFIDLMGPDCALYPSHAAVAKKAKVSERTVWAALNEAERLGLLRVTPRYVYDRERGKRVRTSNLYEVMVTAAQRAAAIVAGAARKAHEGAKRQAAALCRAARGLFHDLTATDAENPQKDIFPLKEKVRHEASMSHSDMIEWCLRASRTA